MPAITPLSYSVDYESCVNFVHARPERALSAPEFTELCEVLLQDAKYYHCPFWLLDGRAQTSQWPAGLYDWLLVEYLPRVWQVLSTPLSVAIVVGSAYWQHLKPCNCLHLGLLDAPIPLRRAWFEDENAARCWLGQQQRL